MKLNGLFSPVSLVCWRVIGVFLIFSTFLFGRLPTSFFLKENFIQAKINYWQTRVGESAVVFFQKLSLDQTEEITMLKQENNLLKQQLKTQKLNQESTIISHAYRLVSNNQEKQYSPGAMVVSNGVLLGFVTKSSQYALKINLLEDTQDKVIMVVTESGAKGLVRGDGENVILSDVAHQVKLQTGEKIFTAGQIEVAPDLFIGFVDQFIHSPTDLAQKARVKKPLVFQDLQSVEIF